MIPKNFQSAFAFYLAAEALDHRTLRHSQRLARAASTAAERTVALLHDVVEDSDTTQAQIAAIFSTEVAEAVDLLTRRSTDTYFDYIRAIAASGNELAKAVKMLDLADHLDPVRIDGIPASLVTRYQRATDLLS